MMKEKILLINLKFSTNVIVLAATNRYDILDDALLRSGRFGKKGYNESSDT